MIWSSPDQGLGWGTIVPTLGQEWSLAGPADSRDVFREARLVGLGHGGPGGSGTRDEGRAARESSCARPGVAGPVAVLCAEWNTGPTSVLCGVNPACRLLAFELPCLPGHASLGPQQGAARPASPCL